MGKGPESPQHSSCIGRQSVTGSQSLRRMPRTTVQQNVKGCWDSEATLRRQCLRNQSQSSTSNQTSSTSFQFSAKRLEIKGAQLGRSNVRIVQTISNGLNRSKSSTHSVAGNRQNAAQSAARQRKITSMCCISHRWTPKVSVQRSNRKNAT